MHSFQSAARRRGRIPHFLFASLLTLTSWGAAPAHANGVSGKISNGRSATGTVTGNGFDTYEFTVPAGGDSFVVSVSETGVHDETFVPSITLTPPGSAMGHLLGRPLYTILRQSNAAEGTWSVKVDRKDLGTSAGSYALTLIQLPGAIPSGGGVTSAALSPGVASSGTNTRGKIDAWTFTGVAGQTETLTLNQTGGAGFSPEIAVVSPTGGILGDNSCESTCSQDIFLMASGTYTVLAFRHDDNDVTGSYSLSANLKN